MSALSLKSAGIRKKCRSSAILHREACRDMSGVQVCNDIAERIVSSYVSSVAGLRRYIESAGVKRYY
jgi:hypothetical protein